MSIITDKTRPLMTDEEISAVQILETYGRIYISHTPGNSSAYLELEDTRGRMWTTTGYNDYDSGAELDAMHGLLFDIQASLEEYIYEGTTNYYYCHLE